MLNYTICNIMSGTGFDTDIMGGFSMAWIGLVVLFFLIVFARRWVAEEMGVPFSWIPALIVGMLAYVVVITFSCSFKFALGIGIVGAIAGGFLLNNFVGGE